MFKHSCCGDLDAVPRRDTNLLVDQKNEPVPGGANINDRYDGVLWSSLRFVFITLRNFVQSDFLGKYPGADEKRRLSAFVRTVCSCCRLA